jgi:hypothetical protein
MLKVVKRAVALAFVFAAASAPVAAQAEVPSFSFTHLVVKSAVQFDQGTPAGVGK